MAGTASAVASSVSSIAGDYMSMQGQQNMNLANRMFSAQQAQIQRNWEQQMQSQAQGYNTMMSDTALQRRMSDAKAAGINPMLAVTTGGASAPMMSAPQGAMAAPPQTGNPMASFANLGQQAQGAVSAALTAAQTRKTTADAVQTEATNPYAAANAKAQITALQAQADNLKSGAMELSARYNVDVANEGNLLQDRRFQAELQEYKIKAADLENQGRVYGLTGQRLLSDFYNTPFGGIVLRAQQVRQAGGEPAADLYMLGTSAGQVFKGFKYDPSNQSAGFSSDPNQAGGLVGGN